MKKFVSLLLSTLMLFSLVTGLTVSAYAADEDFDYMVYEDGTAGISGYFGNAKALVIPSKIDGHTVVEICDDAFYGSSITSVEIPNTVKEIYCAFGECTNLKTVTIPNSVELLLSDAFYGCINLTEINVDKSNKNYSSQDGVLFSKDKTKLYIYPSGNKRTSYTIPSGVKEIYGGFDSSCSLESIKLPESVIRISYGAFAGLDKLKSVEILGAAEIESEAFAGCTNLKSVTLGSKVKSVDLYAFYSCDKADIYFMNKSCAIEDDGSGWTIAEKATIHGYKSSTAEEYAKKYGRTFVAVDEETTKAPTTSAPTTKAPTTQAPTTKAPNTAAPTTKAPTTSTPTTKAPTTNAPAEEIVDEPTTDDQVTEPATDLEETTEEGNSSTDSEETTKDGNSSAVAAGIVVAVVAAGGVAGGTVVFIRKRKMK